MVVLERPLNLLSNSLFDFEIKWNGRELSSFEVGQLCRIVSLKNDLFQNALVLKGLNNLLFLDR